MIAPQSLTLHALGTHIKLTVFGELDTVALTAAENLINQEEDRLTVNRTKSEVMAVNAAAGVQAVAVSSGTFRLIRQAIAASREDFGFNALIGPLVKLWKIGFDGANVPSDAEIQKRLALCDPEMVQLDDQTHQVKIVIQRHGAGSRWHCQRRHRRSDPKLVASLSCASRYHRPWW